MNDLWDKELDAAGEAASAPKSESIGPRREAMLLAHAGGGAVHQHRRFHGRDAAGPAVDADPGDRPGQFGLIVSSYTIARGVAGFVASTFVDRFGRKAAFLTLYTGFLVGTLLCGLATTYHVLLAARVRHRRFRRHPGRDGAGDHRRCLPRGAAGPGDRDPDVGVRLASVVGVPIGLYLGDDTAGTSRS